MIRKTTILSLMLFLFVSLSIHAKAINSTVIAPPANDDCAGATTLTVNSNFLCTATSPGTVFEATASTTPNACPTASPNPNANDDVWFKFVAVDTEHKVELLNISGSETNLYHSVFDAGVTGDCTTLMTSNAIFCSDPNASMLTSLTVGNTYFIRVFTNDSGAHDTTFDICIGSEPAPPVNDDCTNAETVASFPFSTMVDGTSTTNTTGFIDVAGCGGAMNDGLWYTLVGDGSNITVKVTPNAWDPKIAIYTGSCGTFTCIAESNTGTNGNVEIETFTSISGTTYYINIGHPSGASDFPEGVFGLDISLSPLSVDNLISEKGFSYFPNPVRDELKMSANEDIKSINVYNMIGQEVKRISLSNLSSYKLDMSDLSNGVYFIRTKIGDSTGTFKIIKK